MLVFVLGVAVNVQTRHPCEKAQWGAGPAEHRVSIEHQYREWQEGDVWGLWLSGTLSSFLSLSLGCVLHGTSVFLEYTLILPCKTTTEPSPLSSDLGSMPRGNLELTVCTCVPSDAHQTSGLVNWQKTSELPMCLFHQRLWQNMWYCTLIQT